MLAHIQRLIVATGKFLLSFKLVLNGLVHPGTAWCALYIYRIQVAHVGLIQSDAVLEGVSFWRLQDVFFGDLGVVEMVGKMLTAVVHEVILPSGDLGGVLFGLAIEPCAIG